MIKAYLSEIFISVQGEGPHVGERHLFVRFCGCHRRCVFCDTTIERTSTVQVEKNPGSGVSDPIPNPLSPEQVTELIRKIGREKTYRCVSLTGGEPLLHARFLRVFFSFFAREKPRFYLETAGDLPQQLKTIIEWIDVVAMDVKLSSVTGEKNNFPAHWESLKICRDFEADIFVKLILSAETCEKELMEAVKGIGDAGGVDTPVVIQPMTETGKTSAKTPCSTQLLHWQEQISRVLSNVRIIPQTHKMMDMR